MDTGYYTGKAGSEACPSCDGDPETYGRLPRVRRALQPSLIGICHVWIRDVTILGYGASPNRFIASGTTGDMEVIETSVDGRVVQARFHPGGEGNGYGLVVWPLWVQS